MKIGDARNSCLQHLVTGRAGEREIAIRMGWWMWILGVSYLCFKVVDLRICLLVLGWVGGVDCNGLSNMLKW